MHISTSVVCPAFGSILHTVYRNTNHYKRQRKQKIRKYFFSKTHGVKCSPVPFIQKVLNEYKYHKLQNKESDFFYSFFLPLNFTVGD